MSIALSVAEFLNNDIVQDLDRLLTLQPGVGAASLCNSKFCYYLSYFHISFFL